MIIVDSSVWIDHFNGKDTRQTEILAQKLLQEELAIGDIILAEVLQGFRYQKDFDRAVYLFSDFPCFDMLGKEMANQSARNYRKLRAKGITIRKTIDLLIGTFCIEYGHTLLHNDRDFDHMELHLNLSVC